MKTMKIFNKILLIAAAFGVVVSGCSPEDEGETLQYSITVSNDGNGSAEAKINDKAVTAAEEGATVAISATPKEGFVFSKWTVVSGGVQLADANSASTTFKMPAKAVSVKAEFVVATYDITVSDDGNGTATAKAGDAEVTEAGEGQAITLIATPKEGYLFSQWVVSAGGVKLADAAEAETTFTMPAADVAVKAEFTKKEAPKYAIEIIAGENGSAVALARGEKVTEAVEYMSINLVATPDEGYVFSKWIAEGVELFANTEADIVFSMPANAVKITAEFVVKTYGFTVEEPQNGTVTATVDGSPAADALEEGVTVSLKATANEGYIFSQWVATGVTLDNSTAAEISFVMPANEVSVKAEFLDKSSIAHAIEITGDGNGTGSATVGGAAASEAVEGTTVTITATANTGYIFSKWVVEEGGASIADVNAASTSFTMPGNAVTIKAEFAPLHDITLNNDGNGSAAATVGGGAVTAAAEGQNVTITATANTGYTFSKWVVESGGASIADVSAASTTFAMPAAAVTIRAEFYLTPSITYNNDADLWLNTASFALADIPAGATVGVSYKRAGDADWQTAAVDGNKATIAPSWSAGKNEAGLDIYTLDTKTGVFAKNTYQFQLSIDGKVVNSGQFVPADNGGDAIPNGDMSGWSKKLYELDAEEGTTLPLTYPNPEGQTFWDSGNNPFLENPELGADTPLCLQGTGDDAGTASLSARLVLDFVFAAGNMFTGDFIYSGMSGTAHFGQKYGWTARPTALKLRYKAQVGTIDKVGTNDPEAAAYEGKQDRSRIFVSIVDWTTKRGVTSGMVKPVGMWDPATDKSLDEGPILGYGDMVITESVDGWQTVTLPIVWYDKDASAPAADKFSLVISCATSFRGDYLTGCSTNQMFVDDFEWVY